MTRLADSPSPARRYLIGGTAFTARPLEPGLHVVATPIGNLRDITIRAIETMAAADVLACEDTRITRRLVDHFGMTVPLVPYHEHNAAEMRPKLLARLAAGQAVALCSDAGTPLVSDPGFKLVEAVRAADLPVVPVPGPSAVLAALVAAGLPTDAFFFDGFLPVKTVGRRGRAKDLAGVPGSLVFFETGPRLATSLADLLAELGDRQAAVCRELTKAHEEVRRGPLSLLAAHYAASADPKGEIVLVIAPPGETPPPAADDIDAMLRAALATGSVKDAATAVAEATGLARRELYQRALDLAKTGTGGEPPAARDGEPAARTIP
ncbi:16S rRNA (cytidine(1402)-2'-O)-methyltransferase [Phreatobacter stygius]|uniref:Ribosomal RNA small subunit methyltransferase I n=1 Tax=Phreatobacter stygius TaxID=1940610 RepID=A0A4D7ASA7_9HYPH|nr:16S rRNA (cytidine(1402)-2'-O)-methyltransferase [Phreatobacter stygius]QCI64344.1 16S rRNA (cytidine(1402)-2'-O)-methyltransferase [Phreatobacter stygius]